MLPTLRLIVRHRAVLEHALVEAAVAGWRVVRGGTLDGGQVAVLLVDGWRRPGAGGWC